MAVNDSAIETRRTARDLLRFLEEMMQAIVRVDLGEPAIAQLSLLELRILMVLGDSRPASSLREIAAQTETGSAQCSHATERLRGRGLAEPYGGGRGEERAFSITRRGARLLGSLGAGRQKAVEALLEGLPRRDRLRLEGAAHLLGRDLDRLAGTLAT